MVKTNLVCNHCEEIIKWYESCIDEVGLCRVDDKLYCVECLKKLAHRGVDA